MHACSAISIHAAHVTHVTHYFCGARFSTKVTLTKVASIKWHAAGTLHGTFEGIGGGRRKSSQSGPMAPMAMQAPSKMAASHAERVGGTVRQPRMGVNLFCEASTHYMRFVYVISVLAVPLVILYLPYYEPVTANRCFAILIFAVFLWLTNAIPLFVTALLIPLLMVVARVMRDAGGAAMAVDRAADAIVSSMFSPTILVLIASFAIAACYAKYPFPSVAGHPLVAGLASQPNLMLLVVMALPLVASVIMPNMSAALLVYAMLSGQLQGRPGGPSEGAGCYESQAAAARDGQRLRRQLLMGITMGANIGGFISPISSIQSVFAFSLASANFGVTWGIWLKASIPIALVTLFISWAIILFTFSSPAPSRSAAPDPAAGYEPDEDPRCMAEATAPQPAALGVSSQAPRPAEEEEAASGPNVSTVITYVEYVPRWKVVAMVIITLLTIMMWALSQQLTPYVGNIGIISLIPIILLFGLDILSVPDLMRLPWDVVLLAMGAMVFTAAAQSSGLLKVIGKQLGSDLDALEAWPKIALVCFIVLFTGTFKSHFVAALLFLPVLLGYVERGLGDIGDGVAIFLCTSFACSAGMALPFSGMVNLTMSAVTDERGDRILSNGDFLRVGTIISIVTYAVIITLGAAILA